MKKKIAVIMSLFGMVVLLGGWGNKQIFDFNYTFDKAMIKMPDGSVVEGKVDSWTDYEDGDQIQVTMNDKVYLVHSCNVVLIGEPNQ